MKYMNVGKKYNPLNLQFFAGEGEDGDNGNDVGEGDDQDDEDSDEGGDDDQDEKKFSQKDVDDAVKKRLAREKRKWQRDQQKKKEKPDGKDKAGDDGEESEDSKARKAAENRATKAEARVACYEAGVAKDSVDDAIALARSYMENDEDLDLEEAIEKVVKKYPHFKKGTADQDDDEGEGKKKSWGQRQNGRGSKKMSGVEKHFYELNPDLKK